MKKIAVLMAMALMSNITWALDEKPTALTMIQREAGENEIKLFNNRFRIDHEVEEITLLFFRAEGTAPVILVKPDGSKMYATQGITGEYEWYDDLTYDIIKIKNPMPGPWQAVGKILPESRILILTNIELEVEPLPELMFKGETIKLTGRLTNGGEPITAGQFRDVVTLDVDFVSTNDSQYDNYGAATARVAEFKDDGQGFDERPGDAVFTGEFKLDIPAGGWRPEFYLITPLVERRLVHDPIMLAKEPLSYDLVYAKKELDQHILHITLDNKLVDPSTVLLQGRIYYPNNEEQSFSIPASASNLREIKLNNYDWGRYQIEISMFGTNINGREFMAKLTNYEFSIKEPIEIVPAISEADLLTVKKAEAEKIVEPPVDYTIFIVAAIIANLLILLVGWLCIRIFVQKKPLPKLIPNFKKTKKNAQTSEAAIPQNSANARKANDSDEILNLSMPDD
ncbi:TIGR03503 family protein [Pseudoalteromonas tunicata]|uniref:TIGR03503 family protein n=1 Tax=Pseudoalteromonas tunicata TaxID=314281 RepID=UPI00273FF533|nr:TIGR03503 family protein [Pseudoalteromonas tunicata]MDP5213194.1 TIGR03503 family protein [Pseudoalteromonas tunicata]